MADRIALEGAAELQAALLDLGEAVATKVGAKADRDAANFLKAVLVQRAPVGPGNHPEGHLNANITVRKSKARNEHTIVYTVSTGKAFWGWFRERGTVHEPARPWMGPTFDGVAEALITIQVDGLRDGIEREAARAARASGMKKR